MSVNFPLHARHNNGFTLIEVMVSLVIVAVGLLGLAGMHLHSMQGNQGALTRTQASFIANDIATRMRINSLGVSNNDYAIADYTVACAARIRPDCETASCNSSQISQLDITDFICATQNELPNVNNTNIVCNDVNNLDADPCSPGSPHTITLSWVERLQAANENTLADANQVVSFSMVVQ